MKDSFLIRQHLFLLLVLYLLASLLIFWMLWRLFDKIYLAVVVIIICNFYPICSSRYIKIDIPIIIDYYCFTFIDLIYVVIVRHLVEVEMWYYLFLLMIIIALEVSAVVRPVFLLLFCRYNRL